MPFIYALDWKKALNQGRQTKRHTCMHLIRQARANLHQALRCCMLYLDCSVLFEKNGSYKILTITMKYLTRMSSFTVCLWGTCQCEWAVIADRRFRSLIIWWHCCEWRPEPQNCKKCCSVFSRKFCKFSVTSEVIYSFSSQLEGVCSLQLEAFHGCHGCCQMTQYIQ